MPQFTTSDDVVLVVAAVAAILLLLTGIMERRRHRSDLHGIPLRISVNGSRGKSTVTRLLTGALAAAGRRPLGKTTGTDPALILGWNGAEVAIRRRPEGPNILEQRTMVRRAARDAADALVVECMAINPEYQVTFHRDFLDVTLLAITNALDDHLDEMGPTSQDVADVFAESIPVDGTVAVVPGPHDERFRRIAEDRGARLLVATPETVDDAVLARFDHLVLAEHVALVLAITRHLDIPDEVAIRGMLDAPVDPFATRLLPVGDPDDPALFVNAFPANDPASTLGLWEHLRKRGHHAERLTVVMHCRGDRVTRTRQFARDVLPALPIDTLVVTGESTRSVTRAAEEGRIPHRVLHDLTGQDPEALLEAISPLRGQVVLGIGNLHGGAAQIVERLQAEAVGELTEHGAA